MQPLRRHSPLFMRPSRPSRLRLHAALLVAVVCSLILSPVAALAQGPSSFWIPPYVPSQTPPNGLESGAAVATVTDAPFSLIIDADPGVDDSVAIAWLLNEVPLSEILGIVTVAGNTTVENATRNVDSVLSWMEVDVEVVTGANKPLSEKLSSTGKLIHGLDGLWGAQLAAVAHRPHRNDARKFYCDNARENPGATILALGPLTNIAEAIRHCRGAMNAYSRVVVLGGAKTGGNTTPVAEFNFWQDPDAAEIVFKSGLNIDIVPLDGFTQLGFTSAELGAFFASPQPVFQNLALPVFIYGLTQQQAGVLTPSIPDLTAAIYTIYGEEVLALVPPLDPAGDPVPAISPVLVEIVKRPDAVRGQSIIGINVGELASMVTTDRQLDDIANNAFDENGQLDPNYIQQQLLNILMSVPFNARMPIDFLEADMKALFLDVLEFPSMVSAQTSPQADDVDQAEGTIYLPSVSND